MPVTFPRLLIDAGDGTLIPPPPQAGKLGRPGHTVGTGVANDPLDTAAYLVLNYIVTT